jgi:formylglycine-generating enzyme required for sulfatase activity
MRELHGRMTDPWRAPLERLQAADELEKLGWLPDDLCSFVAIPGLSYPFNIGKYPVTNAQYRRFAEAEDFADPQWWRGYPNYDPSCQLTGYWGEEGWQWLQGNWDKRKKRQLPRDWNDARFGITHPGAPVVGITWYEASAYGKWLQGHWGDLEESRKNPGLQPKLARLPVETEWELAAGGAQPEGRYPWDAPGKATGEVQEILRRANVAESSLGRTTPVGMYPLGVSPHGVWDMAGNVWEWQANRYDSRSNSRVLRGGSFHDFAGDARCAYRSWHDPDGWLRDLGFRVVVLPDDSGL